MSKSTPKLVNSTWMSTFGSSASDELFLWLIKSVYRYERLPYSSEVPDCSWTLIAKLMNVLQEKGLLEGSFKHTAYSVGYNSEIVKWREFNMTTDKPMAIRGDVLPGKFGEIGREEIFRAIMKLHPMHEIGKEDIDWQAFFEELDRSAPHIWSRRDHRGRERDDQKPKEFGFMEEEHQSEDKAWEDLVDWGNCVTEERFF